MTGRNNWLWLGTVLGLVLVLISLPSGCSSQVKMSVTQLFSPLLNASTSLREKFDRVRKATIGQNDLVQQSETLHEENVRLQSELQQLREIERENARLREMLQFKAHSTLRLKPARVINRSASNWWVAMDVDVGTNDGVTQNMAVLSHAGLIGKTTDVGRHVARVLLIADPNCKVAALIESSRDAGIVEGDTRGSMETARCTMRFISRNSEVKLDDTVLTSGLDELYPKGIVIGKVVQISNEEYGLYKSAQVRLAADLMHLEEVFVVIGK
jgi:rod shape-determining protein MreC